MIRQAVQSPAKKGGVTKKRGRKPKIKKAFSKKEPIFMPFTYLEKNCCEKESIATINIRD